MVRDRETAKGFGATGRDKESKSGGASREGRLDVRDRNAHLPGSDLPGFMPLREDFDIEYENDAELILADMEFDLDDDHPSERELKLEVIHAFISQSSSPYMAKY